MSLDGEQDHPRDPADEDVRRRREALQAGAAAEALAAVRLEQAGWRILARNWHGRGGELDVVAEKRGRLRFVEVKARSPDDPVGLDAISDSKQRKLVRAARAFLAEYDDLWDEACFTVAWVDLREGEPGHIEWIDDAFDA
ncbi:MAG: YraN family protein [Alphaproteobacteria bacterium]|nr:YraN family protein [Alphaproteobacteria bacterium]